MSFIQRETVLLPCKLDPPHLGHAIQLHNLLKRYNVILDIYMYEGRVTTVEEVVGILADIFTKKEIGRLYVKTHQKSYSKDTSELPYDYPIFTGNEDVYKELKIRQYKVFKMPRYSKYCSTYMRKHWRENDT